MPKPLLGIGFEGILCAAPVTSRAADAGHLPIVPGAIDFLSRAVVPFVVTVYPLKPKRGRAAIIQLALWREAVRHFSAEDHPEARRAADDLIDILSFCETRPEVDVAMEAIALGFTGWGPGLPPMEAVLQAAPAEIERRQQWWAAA